MTHLPSSSRRWRAAGLLLLVAFFMWLPVEDTGEWLVLAYGALVCAWGASRLLSKAEAAISPGWLRYLLAGLSAGTALTPVTLLLMAFKTGAHGHLTPDFTSYQIWRVIMLTPVWILSGALIGLGAGFWETARAR